MTPAIIRRSFVKCGYVHGDTATSATTLLLSAVATTDSAKNSSILVQEVMRYAIFQTRSGTQDVIVCVSASIYNLIIYGSLCTFTIICHWIKALY